MIHPIIVPSFFFKELQRLGKMKTVRWHSSKCSPVDSSYQYAKLEIAYLSWDEKGSSTDCYSRKLETLIWDAITVHP
jgi:hypothetical protein